MHAVCIPKLTDNHGCLNRYSFVFKSGSLWNIKMYCDVPKCFKCCFCLPLRYGLAVWGYLKLIASLTFIGFLAWVLVQTLNSRYGYPMVPLSILIVVSTDTFFDIVLILAAHKKHVKLFECYYYYSLVILVIFIIIMVLSFIYQIVMLFYAPYMVFLILSEITVPGLGIVMLQIYITLLVRTEMIKLRDNCKFEFVNHAAESQCTVNIEINQPTAKTDGA